MAYASAQQLFSAADLVIHATIGTKAENGHAKSFDGRRVRTELDWPTRIVTATVHEVYKGQSEKAVRIAQLSGTRLDGKRMVNDNDPLLDLGAEYVVFLDTYADAPEFAGEPAVIVGGDQGQFRVVDGELEPVATWLSWSLTMAELESLR